jgi:hypothetical protein
LTLYSFLLFNGYLKASFVGLNDKDQHVYELLVPNREVKYIFNSVIIKWLNEPFENAKLVEMLRALTVGDIYIFERILNDFVINSQSYFSTDKRNIEKVYQAFLLGMLVNLSGAYEVNSERESGYGRYDIAIIPKDLTKPAIIMELKKLDEFTEETKDEALTAALKQIDDRQYETDILRRGITKIIKLGITFDGKRVWVKQA